MLTAQDIAAAVPLYAGIHEAVETRPRRDRARAVSRGSAPTDRRADLWIDRGTVAQAQSAGVATVDDVRRHPARLAAFSVHAGETSLALKRFLHEKVYDSPDLGADRLRSTARIGELFSLFLEHPERMPEAYREQHAGELAHRLVCDYIAGMTDAFFRRTYEQMIGTDAQSSTVE
jgi:dGTPase